jgi:hypothetical protein
MIHHQRCTAGHDMTRFEASRHSGSARFEGAIAIHRKMHFRIVAKIVTVCLKLDKSP